MHDRVRTHGPRATGRLSECPRCASGLVQLVEARSVGQSDWDVRRRCPECDWHGGGIASAAALERFEQELDVGRAQLAALLAAVASGRPVPGS
ncbi:MAG: hypothetical protein ACXVII_39570 [Solirubrobacteraceae bacterium]